MKKNTVSFLFALLAFNVLASPVSHAIEKRDVPVKVSSQLSETVSAEDNQGFIAAVKLRQLDRVKQFLSAGIDVNVMQGNKYPAIFYASGKGYRHILQALIDQGADVNQPGRGGWTPLMVAALHGHQDNIALLLAGGADLERQNVDGRSALMYAVAENQQQAVEQLLAAKANVMAVVGENATVALQGGGLSVLAIAISANHLNQVELLLQAGAKPNGRPGAAPPLYYALLDNRLEIAELLLAAKANIHWRDRHGNSLLHRLVLNADVSTIDYLLAKGVVPGLRNQRGESALILAANSGQLPSFQRLLHEASDEEKQAALFAAATSGVTQVVVELLASGVAVNSVDADGRTALMLAAALRHHVLVEQLLDRHGVAINQRDNNGETALMMAVMARPSKLRVVEALLAAGADLDATNAAGRTVLAQAVQVDYVPLQIVRRLIVAGAEKAPALQVLQQLRQQQGELQETQRLALLTDMLMD
ncbi:ankyrin repeat domain-containing protein [Sinobacterium caligoides]|uniref:ankyrin repeat domain-containing protein n=1 Tax=Sinobacterium caligoides TaxID=933926 RepID=UPI0013C2D9AC|nr:ankyrin repeat domain-containing protein [Sinobacterium caligoides]